MMPAVLGLADAVLDRSWLSERPYGAAFREGVDRLGPTTRSLERLAWRCQTLVVRCQPPWERVTENFGRRDELLDTPAQLREVYDAYAHLQTSLPMTTLDPLSDLAKRWADILLHYPGASVPHALEVPSAGNLRGKVTLVGEAFAPVTDSDPLYQWPFGGFSGCSAWLAKQLTEAQISERDLFWVNADALTPEIVGHRAPVVALGQIAKERLEWFGRGPDHAVEHPQYWKRFHHREPYPLLDVLRELIDG
jgi:hypothetical protein